VLFHYWDKLATPTRPLFVDKGYLGVELFFILSGFILCYVYRTSVEDGRYRYGDFLWNRLARVYPLHLATLIGLFSLTVRPWVYNAMFALKAQADASSELDRIKSQRFYLYDKASRDRRVGSGLGLAIVRQLATAMGGDVSVASRGMLFPLVNPNGSQITGNTSYALAA